MIAIVDYGLGNVKAFAHVYKKMNKQAIIAKQAKDLVNATKIILPGVGAFDEAMKHLERSGMRKILEEMVFNHRTPVLGICVGMQMLSLSSEEGNASGLGWLDGVVKKFNFPSNINNLYVPHMGWNSICPAKENALLRKLDQGSRFYFLHSYYLHCNRDEDAIAFTDYGGCFVCAVNHENIYGVQFHPEKSHQWGVQLLKNFAEL